MTQTEKTNPIIEWTEKHADLLFDGTSTEKSYIRFAESDDIEYGLQPHFRPCGGHFHFGGILRVAYKPKPVTDPSAPMSDATNTESSGEREAKLKAFLSKPGVWGSVSDVRLSRGVNLTIPLKATAENKDVFITTLVKVVDKLFTYLPEPAAGWDPAQVEKVKTALLDLMRVLLNVNGAFDIITKTENPWVEGDLPTGVELPENVVAFLDAIEAEPDATTEAADTTGNEGDDSNT